MFAEHLKASEMKRQVVQMISKASRSDLIPFLLCLQGC